MTSLKGMSSQEDLTTDLARIHKIVSGICEMISGIDLIALDPFES
jgi:hypothetical protein